MNTAFDAAISFDASIPFDGVNATAQCPYRPSVTDEASSFLRRSDESSSLVARRDECT